MLVAKRLSEAVGMENILHESEGTNSSYCSMRFRAFKCRWHGFAPAGRAALPFIWMDMRCF